MSTQEENPYQLFTPTILKSWILDGVAYLKVEELSLLNGIHFYELIPDSELLDGDQDTLYAVDSDDVLDMLVADPKNKFLVHRIYLTDEDC